MAGKRQVECRIVITHKLNTFDLGMYDPVSGRHEPLGNHPKRDIDRIVRDLRSRMEQEGHRVTYSEITGRR